MYDYCPPVCTCTGLASQPRKRPADIPVHACPADGYDVSFMGLCSMTCGIDINYCSPAACAVKPKGYKCPEVAPKDPPVPKCVAGTATGDYKDLCEYGCKHNKCPPELCMCTAVSYNGPPAPPYSANVKGTTFDGKDFGLCDWACKNDFCDPTVCERFPPLQLPSESWTQQSSCTQMEQAGLGFPKPEFWNEVDAGGLLRAWFSNFKGQSQGTEHSLRYHCQDNCGSRPDCKDLTEVKDKPRSAPQLMILQSMANLRSYLKAIHTAINTSKLSFAGTDASILVNFWKKESSLDDTTKSCMNGVNTAVGIMTAAGGPAAGPIGPLVSGIFTAMQIGIDVPITFSNLAKLQEYAQTLFKAPMKNMEDAFVAWAGFGEWQGISVQDMLADGAFLDYRTIPIINSDQSIPEIEKDVTVVQPQELANMMFAPILGNIINIGWQKANLILMAYEMTSAQFDTIKIGKDVTGLKYWDPPPGGGNIGTGYFYQQWHSSAVTRNGALDMVTLEWPLGFDKLKDFNLHWDDPFVSSIEAYKLGSWNYTVENDRILGANGLRRLNKLDHPGKIPGVFNISVCKIGNDKSFKDFVGLIADEHQVFAIEPDVPLRLPG
ncbi:hypothetical protein ACHAQH_001171 [Verticillium albo-atrum]